MNWKNDFPILNNGLIYLDSAATLQKPQQVITAMKRFYEEENANVHRGIYKLSALATLRYQEAREIVARFIRASPDEIVFTKGTTESINLLAYSLGKNIQAGDEIVLTEMEHHSNLLPWQRLAKEHQAILKFIPLTADFRLDLNKAQEMITQKTKIVSLTHMSNVLGTINPVKEICEMAHAVGSVCIVDAAQSIAHLPVDVAALNVDFLAFSGHKVGGPTGIGVLYGKKRLLETLEPFQVGGGMVADVTKENATWVEIPERLEAGTPPIAQAVGLAEALQYFQEIGMDVIQQHEQELTHYMLARWPKHIRLIGPSTAELRGPVFSFDIPGVHPHDVAEVLDRQNIAVRAGHHCAKPLHTHLGLTGTTRASLCIYTTREDIDALLQGVHTVEEIFA